MSLLNRSRICFWPFARNANGTTQRPGKLPREVHIVGSVASAAAGADDAFNRNMELGVLVHRAATVLTLIGALQEQFAEVSCPLCDSNALFSL